MRERIAPAELVERIWERDSTVWTGNGESQWLGWLDEPMHARERLADYRATAERALDGVDDVVLLGMGGSSLAPEVLRRTFAVERFHVLDTTHPAAVRTLADAVDPARTLVVAASKSGGTIETRSHLELFWERAAGVPGRGRRFLAITDPGSDLDRLARDRDFAGAVYGEPTIGGRYSTLSPFGLIPAALMGIDLDRLLAGAEAMREACRYDARPAARPRARRGLARRPRQGVHPRQPRRLRAVGRAARRRVHRQAGEGARARPRRARRPGRCGRWWQRPPACRDPDR
jgi:transaldolase/glucose-6-phosphate isomerase